jgi:hypothetical protein
MDKRIIRGASAMACAIGAFVFAPAAHGVLVYAVTEQNILVSFDSSSPGTILNGVAIGNAGQDDIQGIDFRPQTGALYAVDAHSNLTTINVTSGAVTPVNGGANNPINPALNGSNFGFDFNPTVDRIRVVSNADQNFRLDPVTGAVAGTDTNLAYHRATPISARTRMSRRLHTPTTSQARRRQRCTASTRAWMCW